MLKLIPAITLGTVIVSWIAFCSIFITRKSVGQTQDRKRDIFSITGVALQGLSYGIIWAIHRPYPSSIFPAHQSLDIFLAVVAIASAAGAVLFTLAAVRALGKEWSITARVLEGHQLATNGPYAFVRHPIYTGMLGMLVATGLAVSYWHVSLLAVCIFLIGTFISIHSEEKLLRETFGLQFDAYSRKVSAIIPGLF